jgi:flavin reductase (DIM6/NTAB) family NADH-FMN oxidoreductase RutF
MSRGALLKAAMARYTTGVTVVTAHPVGEEPVGFTCNSLTSVSLEPPIILVCIDHASSSRDPILRAGHFGVSVLRAEAESVSRTFASKDATERFHGLDLFRAETGAPILATALSWLDCRILETREVGDHTVVFGEVMAGGAATTDVEGDPLVYHAGRYRGLLP